MNGTSSAQTANQQTPAGRVLVLTPDEQLAGAILGALREAAPDAATDVVRSIEEAQQVVLHQRPDLFVLDIDAMYDLGQEFLYDLRTSHPNARAIVLTAVHFASQRASAAGLGAIHFLEKPFPHGDFVLLVQALLQPGGEGEKEKFQGTLSDLHIADIIQLKCMSGTTSALEFTGPRGEKARVYFEQGQVRHATAPGLEGVAAFNEIVRWRGGKISEVAGAGQSPRTIDMDWQILLMEAVRRMDESGAQGAVERSGASTSHKCKVLVIDDSVMLLNFVKEILSEANYEVATAATGSEGISEAARQSPDLILLDYVLPDMRGEDVLERLGENESTGALRVVYMSGLGTDLQLDPTRYPNVVGSLNKPFTSDVLLQTVENYRPSSGAPVEETSSSGSDVASAGDQPGTWQDAPADAQPSSDSTAGTGIVEAAAGGPADSWWSAPASSSAPAWDSGQQSATSSYEPQQQPEPVKPLPDIPIPSGAAYFCGDTSFFSFNWALHAIGGQKLTGTLRCFWEREPVELLARGGEIILATTRDPELYCAEAPITLVNVDAERTAQARDQQRQTGRPLFLTLADEGLILREPAIQLVQHYGQKLFGELWATQRARFMFEQASELPDYTASLPGEGDIDHWALGTLRFVQFQDLGKTAEYDVNSVPAYTRDGFERAQKLRLTVAEAQFASQFNGARSIAQIAKNLRLDVKFARLTLFRFLALEIVELWPSAATAKPERRGIFSRLFGS